MKKFSWSGEVLTCNHDRSDLHNALRSPDVWLQEIRKGQNTSDLPKPKSDDGQVIPAHLEDRDPQDNPSQAGNSDCKGEGFPEGQPQGEQNQAAPSAYCSTGCYGHCISPERKE